MPMTPIKHITLTEWWKHLEDDLKQLEPTLSNGDPAWKPAYFSTAMEMSKKGQTIEANIISGVAIASEINEISKGFGTDPQIKFTSSLAKDIQYLPQVTNPEELVFALTYYRHLSRYQEIGQVDKCINSFIAGKVLGGISERKKLLEDNTNEMKRRIVQYAKPDNVEAIKQAFPTIAANLLSQVEKLAEPVESKLLKQMEAQANTALENFRKNKLALIDLLGELNQSCLEKEEILRKIAIHKKYIEELSEGRIKPSDLQDPKKRQSIHQEVVKGLAQDSLDAVAEAQTDAEGNADEKADQGSDGNAGQVLPDLPLLEKLEPEKKLEILETRYPQELAPDAFDISGDDRYAVTQYSVSALRSGASALSWVGNRMFDLVSSVSPSLNNVVKNSTTTLVNGVTSTAGKIAQYTPSFLNNGVRMVAGGVSKLTELHLPVSNEENKKTLFISKAETTIATLAETLNYEGSTDISAKDFSKMTSKQINELADKVSIIGHMVNIQKCLAEYCQRQTKGVVKVTRVGVINQIIEWLSDTPVRRLIHDRLLLTIEAKKLQKNLSELVKQVKSERYNQSAVEEKLDKVLSKTQEQASIIEKRKSIYGRLFKDVKKEFADATEELKQVVEGGKKTSTTPAA